jgi:hypothetical protein
MWDFKFKSFLHGYHNPDELPVLRKGCDAEGCEGLGEYRAPRSRLDLSSPHRRPDERSYYRFCLDHVRQYNANWDFFKGMSDAEMQHHLYKTGVWDRPTWRAAQSGAEEKIRKQVHEQFAGFFADGAEDEKEAHIDVGDLPHPTVEALAVMNLTPPVDWDEVKTRYKTLAKKYHPDTNKGDRTAEEKFKKITLAYTILKLSYENFTKLEER